MSHRQVYKQCYGPIPKGYEIHHIDGDHANNHPANLQMVTIQEHYDIHWKQGDYVSCMKMARRMKITPEDRSKIASMSNLERVKKGTHPWVGPHHNQKMIEAGTHNFLGSKNPSLKLYAKGIHPFQDSERSRKLQIEMVRKGTHNFLHQPKHTCPHCGLEGTGGSMYRWHFDKCKLRGENGQEL